MNDSLLTATFNEFAAAQAVGYGLERSVKFSVGQVGAGRGLISFHRSAIEKKGGWQSLQALLSQLQFTGAATAALAAAYQQCELVHFGLEGSRALAASDCIPIDEPSQCTAKIYFESTQVTAQDPLWSLPEWRQTAVKPVFLAYKWSANKALRVSHYGGLDVAGDSPTEWATRLQSSCQPLPSQFATTLSELLLSLAIQLPAVQRQLLSVIEPVNSRRSFDLNLYPLQLACGQLEGPLQQLLSEGLGLSAATAADWLQSVAEQPLGHIGWGLGGDKQPYVSLYFGAVEIAAGEYFC